MLRATWYEGTAQLLSLTELKSRRGRPKEEAEKEKEEEKEVFTLLWTFLEHYNNWTASKRWQMEVLGTLEETK